MNNYKFFTEVPLGFHFHAAPQQSGNEQFKRPLLIGGCF